MAANTPIGNVTSMTIQYYDIDGIKGERKIWGELNQEATYEQVDTFARNINGLTTNTYNDTTLITEKSVNEEMDS